jgi:ABC-2 type transport system ATP-binding protein
VSTVIEVDGLRKSYSGVERVHGISFSVSSGQVFGFLGVNGAGKTSTIEILEGYRSRDSGAVAVLGVDPWRAGRGWRNRIGLVLQDSTLNPVYKVRETVSMFAHYFRAPTAVDRVLRLSGLAEQSEDRIGRLSGGQKRRVDVALGLVGDPEILFLDEPTTGLDPAARREMWTMIDGLRQAGKTVFLTTHYMDEAQYLSDDIVILRSGSIVAHGSPDQLRHGLGSPARVSFAIHPESRFDPLTMPFPRVTSEAGEIRFESDHVQRDLAALLAWAEDRNVELLNLKVTEPSLDDVFIQIAVSGDAADQSSTASGSR